MVAGKNIVKMSNFFNFWIASAERLRIDFQLKYSALHGRLVS
jgi:hypothetical protein